MGFDPTSLARIAEEVGSLGDSIQVIPESDLNRLHTDGDYAAYYFAGNDETPLGTAKRNMVGFFQAAATIVGVKTSNILVHITDPMSDKGKRYLIADTQPYQEQRGKSAKPKNWQGMRDFLQSGMPGSGMRIVNWLDREADDGAAFMSSEDLEQGRHPTILFRDKDWRMFAGQHMRWLDYELVQVPVGAFEVLDNESEVYGHKFFWLQMLMGDSTDNIPGLERVVYVNSKGKLADKNCGPVCAAEFLAGATSNDEAFAIVAGEYEEYYGPGWEVKFAEQAMLLWMRTGSADANDYLRVIPAKYQESMMKANKFIFKRMQR